MALDADVIKLQSYIRIPFRGEVRETTLGRVLFNEIFPEDFPFQDEAYDQEETAECYGCRLRKYGQDKTAEIADDLKDIGFEYATNSGLSMGMGDFAPIEGMDEVIAGR